jgi:aspartate/glutamate racemase
MENSFFKHSGYSEIPIQDTPEIYVVRTCKKQSCWRARKKGAKLLCLAGIYVAFVVCNVLHRVYNEIQKQGDNTILEVLRVRRDAPINNETLGEGRFQI